MLAGAVCVSVLAGCTTKNQYYEEISMSRKAAYQQWKARKHQQLESQPQVSGNLGITRCLELTLKHNKMLQRVLEEKGIARGEKLKAISAYLPKVAVQADVKRYGLQDVEIPEIPGVDVNMPPRIGDVTNNALEISVTQPIYAGGAIPATVNSAELTILLADQAVRTAFLEIVYAARHSYYDVLLSQHLLEISSDAVRSAQAHLDSVKQKRQGGIASDFDVLRAEVELSNFQAQQLRNQNAIHISHAQLIRTMGVSQDSDFILSDSLTYEVSSTTLDKAVQMAFDHRPDLYQGEISVKLKQQQVKMAKSHYLPRVQWSYGQSLSSVDIQGLEDKGTGSNSLVWLSAQIPIFDGFARQGRVVQQRARLKQAQIDLIDTEETVLFELTRAVLSIEDANEFVISQKLNLTRAQEGLRLAEVGYQQGVNTQVEMIDTQSALTTARVNYYQAIYSHVIAKLNLQKAMGTLAPTPKG